MKRTGKGKGGPFLRHHLPRALTIAVASARIESMQPVRAHVRNGRIVVDEPTDLPEGAELGVVIADGGDELDAAARERLHASIARGIADVRAGREMEADEFLEQLDSES